MADRYGSTLESPFDGSFREARESSRVLVLEAQVRLTTQPLAMWWAPTSTDDVRQLALSPLDTRRLAEEGERLTRLFDGDTRAEYQVSLSYNAARELEVLCTIQPTDGPALAAIINATTGALEVGPA